MSSSEHLRVLPYNKVFSNNTSQQIATSFVSFLEEKFTKQLLGLNPSEFVPSPTGHHNIHLVMHQTPSSPLLKA